MSETPLWRRGEILASTATGQRMNCTCALDWSDGGAFCLECRKPRSVGNQDLGDDDESNITLFESDGYADNGDEDLLLGSPTGEREP